MRRRKVVEELGGLKEVGRVKEGKTRVEGGGEEGDGEESVGRRGMEREAEEVGICGEGRRNGEESVGRRGMEREAEEMGYVQRGGGMGDRRSVEEEEERGK